MYNCLCVYFRIDRTLISFYKKSLGSNLPLWIHAFVVRSCNSRTPPTVVSVFLTHWLQHVWRKCLVHITGYDITVGIYLLAIALGLVAMNSIREVLRFSMCLFHPLYFYFFALLGCVWQRIKLPLLKVIV